MIASAARSISSHVGDGDVVLAGRVSTRSLPHPIRTMTEVGSMEVISKEKEASKVIEIGELLGVSFGNNEDDFVKYIAEMEVSDVDRMTLYRRRVLRWMLHQVRE